MSGTVPRLAATARAVGELAETWSADEDLAGEIAGELNCEEITPLIALFEAAGYHEVAELWLHAHARRDLPEDEHYDLGQELAKAVF